MVRRRADEPDTRRGKADLGDDLVDLVARELPPLARLRALGDLDLQLVGVGEVPDRHAEAARGDLLDCRARAVAVGERLEALGVLAALASIGLAADTVHGDGEGLVGLGGNRAKAHGPGAEALDDLARRLHLVEAQPAASRILRESQETSQRAAVLGVLVGQLREPIIGLTAVAARCDLQGADVLGTPGVSLASGAPVKLTRVGKLGQPIAGSLRVTDRVAAQRLGGDDVKTDSLDPARSPGEAAVDDLVPEPHGLENLRALVALKRRDAHLRHDLEHSLGDALGVGDDNDRVRVLEIEEVIATSLPERLERQIRIDRIRAVANQQAVVMHFSGFPALQHDADPRALRLANEVMVHPTTGE